MSDNDAENTYQRLLVQSPNQIAELLGAAANANRILILGNLMKGELGLSEVVQASGLSKNATVNHLKVMIGSGLVGRTGRGKYCITDDGRAMMNAVARAYRDSTARGEHERDRLQVLYATNREGVENMRANMIKRKGHFQCSWISFVGAMAGSVTAMGKDCDIADIGGVTGYSFLINVKDDLLCPSGPTAINMDGWGMLNGLKMLGIRCTSYESEGGYPSGDEPTEKDLERARALFEKVCKHIDEQGDPIVVWGIPIPEYGIVNGYEGESYICSTYRSEAKDEHLHYSKIQAPGCIYALFPERSDERRENGSEVLSRAIAMATGNVRTIPGYAAGPKALEVWAGLLSQAKDKDYFGHSYITHCYSEGQRNAGIFLQRLVEGTAGPQKRLLKEASESYAKAAQLMAELGTIFPFAFQGKMEPAKTKRGSELLREVKSKDEDAIIKMREALSYYKK